MSSSTRRQALKVFGMAAGAAGAVAVGSPTGAVAPARASSAPTRDTRTITATQWRLRRPGVAHGSIAAPDVPRLPHGVLLADSSVIGALSSDVAPAAFGGGLLHHLDLGDGTLSAAGPEIRGDGTGTFRVVAGTGRYATATGTYSLHQELAPHGGTATIVLDITLVEY